MCGRNAAEKNFDPLSLDLDVQATDLVGLGRGRGFKSTGHASILGKNDTCMSIKERCFDLVELFEESGITTKDEIAKRFGLHTADDLERERDESGALREEREHACGIISHIINRIEESMESYGTYTFEDNNLEGAVSALAEAVEALIDALSARREEASESMEAAQVIITEIENNLDVGGEFAIDYEGGLENALVQLSNAVERVLDEVRAGGENREDSG
jgi:hypothetical protein